MGLGILLSLALVTLGFSCQGGRSGFSHQQHVEKQGLACSDCHAGSPDGVRAGAPDPRQCQNCHEEASKYSDLARRLAGKWPRLRALPADGKFSHGQHKEAGVECQSCHGQVAKSKRVAAKYLPTEAVCRKCHREMGVGNDCVTCHQKLNPRTAPPDHGPAWKRLHGPAAQDPIQGERCLRCHQKNSCASCHSLEKPADHSSAWLNFGHGNAAGIDRSRCAVCHRSDYCIRCHQESPPVSHAAGWGPPLERHCRQCHLTVSVSNCSVCHGAGVRHVTAPARPDSSPHNSPTDCRACHQGFLLPHPDNGDNCKTCHK